MKKLAIGILGGVLLWSGAGCGTIPASNAYWEYRLQKLNNQDTNSVQSSADRMHVLRQVADQDARALGARPRHEAGHPRGHGHQALRNRRRYEGGSDASLSIIGRSAVPKSGSQEGGPSTVAPHFR